MDYRLKCQNTEVPIQCNVEKSHQFSAALENKTLYISAERISPYELFLTIDGRHYNVFIHGNEQEKDIQINGREYHIEDMDLLEQQSAGASEIETAPSDVIPPMPSIVTRILVQVGDHVEKAQSLIIVSAMKMETTLSAPYNGVVTKIHVAEGDKVAAKQVLMDIDED